MDQLIMKVQMIQNVDQQTPKELSELLTDIDQAQDALKTLRDEIKTRVIVEKLNLPHWKIVSFFEKQTFKGPKEALACLDLLKTCYKASDTILMQTDAVVVSVAKCRDYIKDVLVSQGVSEDMALDDAKGVIADWLTKPVENFKLQKRKPQ